MSIDRIGTLYLAQTDPEAAPVALSGWHYNVTADEIEANPALSDFVVTPSQMRRVWAGDDPAAPTITVALRFADDAEASDVLAAPAE